MKTNIKQKELARFRRQFAKFQEQTAPDEFPTRKYSVEDSTITRLALLLVAVMIFVPGLIFCVWLLIKFATYMAAHGQ